MPADDFVGMVTLDAFRARIPAGDDTVWIEHEERIVGDATHEEPQLPLAFGQRLPRRFTFGDVAGDVCKPDEIAVLVLDRLDHGNAPETAAVLALAPTLRLDTSERADPAQQLHRPAEAPIFMREEDRIILTDHFVGAIAGDPLRARIPARNRAVGIQHVDGAIGNGIDQQLKPPFRGKRCNARTRLRSHGPNIIPGHFAWKFASSGHSSLLRKSIPQFR